VSEHFLSTFIKLMFKLQETTERGAAFEDARGSKFSAHVNVRDGPASCETSSRHRDAEISLSHSLLLIAA
jgi:hypothetical protein